MRKQLETLFCCSKCGKDLTIDPEVKINYNSAYNATITVPIKPCDYCFEEAERPSKTIAYMIEEIVENTLKKSQIKG